MVKWYPTTTYGESMSAPQAPLHSSANGQNLTARCPGLALTLLSAASYFARLSVANAAAADAVPTALRHIALYLLACAPGRCAW